MHTFLKDKLFLVLAALLAITLLSWLSIVSLKLETQTIGVLLLFLAFVKVRLIIIHYMEANKAYLPIRIAFEAWFFLVGGITIALYLH